MLGSYALAAGLSATFVILTLPLLATLPHDFDESWLMLDARFILRGERPFVDFPHHEMPLHLYLLALFGKVFGQTVFGYRMLSLASLAVSGVVLFAVTRPLVGPLPGLVAQAVFLCSPVHSRTLTAIPETPMVLFTSLGVLFLFSSNSRWSAWASGVAFVAALLIKPTCLPMILAAAVSLAYGREWRRLRDLAVAGVVATTASLVWVNHVSDGVFAEILRFQLGRLGTRSLGMWSIDSGFSDIRRLAEIETPRQWAVLAFKEFFHWREEYLPASLFVISLLALPIWATRLGRSRPTVQAFALLWPASYLFVNFVALDFVSPRYFVPFAAFSAFLLAGWVWLLRQYVRGFALAAAGTIAAIALASHVRPALRGGTDPWYWGRLAWIGDEAPSVVSFSPMLFASTGTEPGCGLANAALTYGGFGEAWLVTERTRRFRFSDERLIECLRANPEMPIVIDWAFYFFTRPGSPLRQYLAGEGSGQRLFFSPDAVLQWDRPLLEISPLR